MRNQLKFSGLICVALLMSGTTYAQIEIEGIYIAADTVNTEAVGGGEFTDGFNGLGSWLNQSGGPGSLNDNNMLTGGIFGPDNTTPNGGFQLGNDSDTDIVSTYSGPDLVAGQTYEVSLIWQYPTFISFPLVLAGLEPNPTTQIPGRDEPEAVLLVETPNQPIYTARTVALGTATANSDGEIQVFISNGNTANVNSGALSGAAFIPVATSVTPASEFTVFRGIQLTGELADSFDSDDSRLTFNPGFTIGAFEAPVWLIFDAVLDPTPSSLSITVESSAGTPGLTVTTEAFNFTTDSYDEVDVRAETFNDDSIANIDISSGIADYVDADGNTRTRIGWRQTGFTIGFPWEARLDQVVWE